MCDLIAFWLCCVFSLVSFCSITLGGFGADRFYLGQWREGLGKLFSFGGLGIWTLIDVLLIGVGYVGPADGSLYIWSKAPERWPDGLCPLSLHTASLSKMEDLRCCVLGMIARPILLCNTSSSHLLTGRMCFRQWLYPHNHQINPNHSASVSYWDSADGSAGGWRASHYVCLVGLT